MRSHYPCRCQAVEWLSRLPGATTPGSVVRFPAGRLVSDLRCEELHAVVVRVGDPEQFITVVDPDGNTERRIELAEARASLAERRQELPGRVELLDAVVALVDHEDVAGAIHGNARWQIKLAVAAA